MRSIKPSTRSSTNRTLTPAAVLLGAMLASPALAQPADLGAQRDRVRDRAPEHNADQRNVQRENPRERQRGPDDTSDFLADSFERLAFADSVAVRMFLAERLRDMESAADALRQAIEAIDNGASPEDVLPRLRAPMSRLLMVSGANRQADRDPGRTNESVDLDSVRTFMAERIPEMSERLEQIEATNPEDAERFLRRLGPRIARLMQEFESDPVEAQAKLDHFRRGAEVAQLVRPLRAAIEADDTAEIERLRGKLRELFAQHFESEIDRRSAEIAEMETALQRRQAALAKLQSDRDASIDARVKQFAAGRFGPSDRSDRGGAPQGDRQRNTDRDADRDRPRRGGPDNR